jgi:hypothetical protein
MLVAAPGMGETIRVPAVMSAKQRPAEGLRYAGASPDPVVAYAHLKVPSAAEALVRTFEQPH